MTIHHIYHEIFHQAISLALRAHDVPQTEYKVEVQDKNEPDFTSKTTIFHIARHGHPRHRLSMFTYNEKTRVVRGWVSDDLTDYKPKDVYVVESEQNLWLWLSQAIDVVLRP